MPGNPLNITLPTVGSTLGPIYATLINAAIQALIDDVEAKVTPDEMSINSNLSFKPFGTAYAATDLERTQYESQNSALGAGNVNSVYAKDGELYFQDGSGNNVPVTSSGGVAAAAGNITTTGTPAYASSGVEILWSGGDLEYRFKDGSGVNSFADIVFANAEFRSGAYTMRMIPGSMSADFDLTWFGALPATAQLLSVSAAGVIAASNTIAEAVTLTSLLTANAGVTAAANQHVTVSGTGEFKHGEKKLWIHASGIAGVGGAFIAPEDGAGPERRAVGLLDMGSAPSTAVLALPLSEGDRIKEIKLIYNTVVASSGWELEVTSVTDAGSSTPEFNNGWTSGSTGYQSRTVTQTIPCAVDTMYYVKVISGSAGDLLGVRVTYDRP